MTLGEGNFTLTSKSVGSSLGPAQLGPLEMAPRGGMATNRHHIQNGQTISRTRAKAGHLLHPGNHHQATAQIISKSSSIRTGAPLSLFLLRDTMYLNTSTCWEPNQQSHQARTQMRLWPTTRQLASSRRLEETRSRPQKIGYSQIWWTMMISHHFQWHRVQHQHGHKCR